MKTLVLFDKKTGETKGYVKLTTDSDVNLYDADTSLEIPSDHPAVHDQDGWKVVNRKLKKG